MDAKDFYNHIRIDENGCWNWTRATRKTRGGYGVVYLFGREYLAHRASYELSKGAIPRGKFVCHSCDNPPCVNPEHLWLGSHRENMKDATTKGRRVPPPIHKGDQHPSRLRPETRPRGESHALAKTDAETVTAIRHAYIAGELLNEMAARFGVRRSFVQDVVYGRVWRHLFGVDGSPTMEQLRAVKRDKPGAKITREIAETIRQRLASGALGIELAAAYGLHKATISDIRRGKIWS